MAEQGDQTSEEGTIIEEAGRRQRQRWTDLLPTDVLRLVALRLPPPDLFSFQKVCKQWRSIHIESYPLGRSPLLFFHKHDNLNFARNHGLPDKLLYFYSPLYNRTFSWATSDEVVNTFYHSCMCHFSYCNYGWFVSFEYNQLRQFEHLDIVLVNPFLPSTNIIKWRVPQCGPIHVFVVSMSAPPTDPSCIFLLMTILEDRIKIIAGSEGGSNWKVNHFDLRGDVDPNRWINPVFHGGMFYFLDISGAIGIYDPYRRTWVMYHLRIAAYKFGKAFPVESNGELLGVFEFGDCEYHEPWVDHIVYKLNLSSMEWEELRELRGWALFLSKWSAISAVAEVEAMKDRIFYNTSKYKEIMADCELQQSADGGQLRLIPRPHVRMGKFARRAEGELVGSWSDHYHLHGSCSTQPYMKCIYLKTMLSLYGTWVQPNWG